MADPKKPANLAAQEAVRRELNRQRKKAVLEKLFAMAAASATPFTSGGAFTSTPSSKARASAGPGFSSSLGSRSPESLAPDWGTHLAQGRGQENRFAPTPESKALERKHENEARELSQQRDAKYAEATRHEASANATHDQLKYSQMSDEDIKKDSTPHLSARRREEAINRRDAEMKEKNQTQEEWQQDKERQRNDSQQEAENRKSEAKDFNRQAAGKWRAAHRAGTGRSPSEAPFAPNEQTVAVAGGSIRTFNNSFNNRTFNNGSVDAQQGEQEGKVLRGRAAMDFLKESMETQNKRMAISALIRMCWAWLWPSFGHTIYVIDLFFFLGWSSKYLRRYIPEIGKEWSFYKGGVQPPQSAIIPLKYAEMTAMGVITLLVAVLDLSIIASIVFIVAVVTTVTG